MVHQSINFSSANDVYAILIKASKTLKNSPLRQGCTVHLPSNGRLLVTGDLHDNPINLEKAIRQAELHSPENHILLQELIHSTDESKAFDLSYRMLVRVAFVIAQHPNQVHPILANHELSQATGCEITKRGAGLVGRFNSGVKHVFGKDATLVLKAIDEFIFSMPLAVKTKSGLMCLHSLPNKLSMNHYDPKIINRDMTAKDFQTNTGSAYLTVWGRKHGPQQIKMLKKQWGVALFCLGHALVPNGIKKLSDDVILLNSDHHNGVVLPIQLGLISCASKTMQSAVRLNSIPLEPLDF